MMQRLNSQLSRSFLQFASACTHVVHAMFPDFHFASKSLILSLYISIRLSELESLMSLQKMVPSLLARRFELTGRTGGPATILFNLLAARYS